MLTATLTLVLLTAGAGQGQSQAQGQGYDSSYDDSSYDSGSSVDSNAARGRGMPQTCYAPRYGCYPGNDRFMHRYPAYHGLYYRRPYNYRNLFDYPWHADLHEPTSMFSYDVPAAEEARRPNNLTPPQPPRDTSSLNHSRSALRPTPAVGNARYSRME